MATHSSILAWRIPWPEEPGRLQFMGSKRVGHDWEMQQAAWYFYYFYYMWWSNIHFVLCCAKLLQSGPTLSNSMNLSPPCPSVHWISQARILKWVACPPPGDLPDPGIKPESLMSPALTGGFFTTSITWKAPIFTLSFTE